MGIAVCPDDSRHREELIAYADASLTEAKQVSGNALVVAQREPGEIIAKERSPFGVLDALVRAVDRKDRYTRRHSQQNAEFAVELGKAVGLTEGAVSALRIAGLLHDVGKIGVPDDILKKPGPLSDEERALMREHVVLSNLIVHGIPNLEDVSDAVYCHHERWDGMGYPRGLKGEEIPLPGRIMATVEAYSAMILDRPYRKALTGEEAAAELRRNSGTQFDPELVEPFIQLLESSEAAAA
jgi:HD-GYP domain-containing protein (c-di-GMP phosphodiesterase class II)